MNLSCYVLPAILNDLQSCGVPKRGWNIPNEYLADLADPALYKTGSVVAYLTNYWKEKGIRLNVGSLSLQVREGSHS